MTKSSDQLGELRIDRSEGESPSTPKGTLLAIAVVLVVVAAGAAWWMNRARPTEVRVADVTMAAGAATATAVLDASGYVVARLRATVSSKVTGRIIEVLIEEGTSVVKGQVLARLDSELASRQLALAEAQLESLRRSLTETEVRVAEARLNLQRSRELLEAGVSTKAQLDSDRAQVDALVARLDVGGEEVEVARKRLALRQQELDDLVIRAPFSGVAVTKNAQPGEMISPVSAGGSFTRTGICTLVDMTSLEIEVDVNEAYIGRVRRGQKVVATLDAYPNWQIAAAVITPVPTADRQKATVRVRISFDELDPRILPDMGIKVSFLGEQPAIAGDSEPLALVPTAAIRDEGDRRVVFVARGETAERRAVRLGSTHGSQVEVLAGLQPGESVIIEGGDNLSDGDPIAVQ